MNKFLKQTNEVIKLNLRQLVIFLIMYRLVAGTFYIRAVNGLLRFSLHMAGYSYLTMSNMGAFLWQPFTIPCVLLALFAGMILMLIETGGLVTVYQASAYGRRLSLLMVFQGAFIKIRDEWNKRNWQLLFAALCNYLLMNCFILFRILTRVRPVNFVLYEILHAPASRLLLVVLGVFLILAEIPSMLLFFTCMIEQKGFRDGLRRSWQLLKERWLMAVGLMLAVNLLLLAGLVVLYIAIMAISAILVTVFADGYASMAVLMTVSSRLEAAVLFTGALLAVVVDFGALTVLYYQFERRAVQGGSWDFSYPGSMHFKKKWFLTLTAVLTAASLFMIFDMVYNGVSSDWAVLGWTEITAHRGSSKMAPENTLAALQTAMDEMADSSEIDVQTTADGVVVLCHDLNLKRITGVNRRLSDMTYEETRQLDMGHRFGQKYKGEPMPALEEALALCKGRMKLNIELKNVGQNTDLPEKTAELVKEYGMEDQCIITSVTLRYLKRVKAVDENLKTGYILAAGYGPYYENDDIDIISIRSSFITKRLVETAHANGKAVHTWTVNSKTEMERMMASGVDNIITDYPVRAREILYKEDAAAGLLEHLRAVLR